MRSSETHPMFLLSRLARVLSAALLLAVPLSAVEIMPVDEVRAGLEGEWHTVVDGTTVERFPLRILGVIDNYVGPGKPGIVAEALDETNRLSGPVAGMSGSPVYIEGRLVGAYAYGYMAAKDQAIIGIQPIESMLPLVQDFPLEPAPLNPSRPEQREVLDTLIRREQARLRAQPLWRGAPGLQDPSTAEVSPLVVGNGSTAAAADVLPGWRGQPVTLALGGFGPAVQTRLAPFFAALGAAPHTLAGNGVQTAAGGTSGATDPLEPGAAVAAVLMHGDFTGGATGTVTWRQGDQLMAFGHPFNQDGPTHLPLASVEVLTVVRQVFGSFKLSRIGEPLGSFYQDRLTGVAGRVGPVPPMTTLRIDRLPAAGSQTTFHAQLARDPQWGPLLVAGAVLQAASETLDSGGEQTFFVRGEWQVTGEETVAWEDVGVGAPGAFGIALGILDDLLTVWDNPFNRPELTDLRFSVETRDTLLAAVLSGVQIRTPRVQAGDDLVVDVELHHFLGGPASHRVTLSVPPDLPSGTRLQLVIADGPQAAALATDAPSPTSVRELLAQVRDRRSSQGVYVMLVARDQGLRLPGAYLPTLPPSVAAQLETDRTHLPRETVRTRVLTESAIPTPGVFRGFYRIPLTLE